MRNLPFLLSISIILSVVGTAAASSHSRCDGDFQMIEGRWIATRACQRQTAERSAEESHMHIARHPSGPNEESTEEFCRGNPDIRYSTLCAAYKD
jgi:hypothetical protein